MEARPALVHYGRLPDVPVWSADNAMHLYLAVAANAEKIGVTSRPHQRMMELRARNKCPFEEFYMIELPRYEARKRERVIKWSFGDPLPGKACRWSEWLPRHNHALILAAMSVPEFCELLRTSPYGKFSELCVPRAPYLKAA